MPSVVEGAEPFVVAGGGWRAETSDSLLAEFVEQNGVSLVDALAGIRRRPVGNGWYWEVAVAVREPRNCIITARVTGLEVQECAAPVAASSTSPSTDPRSPAPAVEPASKRRCPA